MKPPDPVHELERRTAAGEVAPIPDRNRRGFDRSLSAALAQLRLRETKPDLDPVPRMLAEVRRVFVERTICSRPEALSRILPGDSFETLLATQDDTACFRSPPRGGRGGRNSRRERGDRRAKTSRGVRGVRGVDSTVRDFD